jgi:glyoxylase-like metal-dependent hydrolase (beta-lactamase superfamily II)
VATNALTDIAPGIGGVHESMKLLGFVDLGHRMTILDHAEGGLLVHSPLRYHPGWKDTLAIRGVLRALVAPSLMHNLYLPEWQSAYPDVPLLAAPGMREAEPSLRVDAELAGDGDELLGPGFRTLFIEGIPKLGEVVLLHEPTRTLIVADLVFNKVAPASFGTRAFLWMLGAYGGVRVSKLLRSLIKDRAAARRSIDRVLEWDFDRLVPGHGRVIETGARDALREAWSFLS